MSDPHAAPITLHRHGQTVEIRMERPEKKNALTLAMYDAMTQALSDAACAQDVRAVLFTGAGDAFTSGNDLKDFLAMGAAGAGRSGPSPQQLFLHALATNPKVVIAAVQGPAVGIGTTLLLHCDLVIASETARFHLPFVTMGLVPEAGSSLLLPESLGRRRAAEMLLLADPMGAEEAQRVGLINRVVPAGTEREAALALARRLEALPPAALRATKRLMTRAAEPVADRMAAESVEFAQQLASAELREAVAAFLEKRTPDFSRAA